MELTDLLSRVSIHGVKLRYQFCPYIWHSAEYN